MLYPDAVSAGLPTATVRRSWKGRKAISSFQMSCFQTVSTRSLPMYTSIWSTQKGVEGRAGKAPLPEKDNWKRSVASVITPVLAGTSKSAYTCEPDHAFGVFWRGWT
jgi:hypothetical protein